MSIDPFTGEFESRREAKLIISRVNADTGPDVYLHLIAANGQELAALSLKQVAPIALNETRNAILKWIGEMNNTKPPAPSVEPPTRFEREEVI